MKQRFYVVEKNTEVYFQFTSFPAGARFVHDRAEATEFASFEEALVALKTHCKETKVTEDIVRHFVIRRVQEDDLALFVE